MPAAGQLQAAFPQACSRGITAVAHVCCASTRVSLLPLPLQAAFLEILAAEGEEGWAAGEAAVAPLLRRKPELAAEAAALAKSKGEQVGVG